MPKSTASASPGRSAAPAPSAIIFLTMHANEDLFNEAMDLGVEATSSRRAPHGIVDGIRAVAAASTTSPRRSPRCWSAAARRRGARPREPGLGALTPTERRMLQLVADWQTSKEIADELFIHYRTVENHRINIARSWASRPQRPPEVRARAQRRAVEPARPGPVW